jgi:hypothetical protein
MDGLETLGIDRWDASADSGERAAALDALEHGRVVFLPKLAFVLEGAERDLLSPRWSTGRSKNISYDPRTGDVAGTTATGADRHALRELLTRYAGATRSLLESLVPDYRLHLVLARTSFRPVQVVGRVTSWRKDDQRLHTDAYPSQPTRGARILRVFSNVHPGAEGRVWRIGEPFDAMARTFVRALRTPLPGTSTLLAALRLTKGRRTAYDSLMLQLHDRVKRDLRYQEQAPQSRVVFPPGSTWIVFTDQVLHAVMSGQHALEQTFYLPVAGQRWPETAPLSVLERLTGRALVHR